MEIFGPGAVLQTTDNIEAYATRLAQESARRRSCGIAIANKTDYNLRLPRRYLSTGRITCMPLTIPPGNTGLILCEKRPLLVEGSCGLITYKIEEPFESLHQLQILWWVPLELNMHSCKVNVRVGVESASEDIFQNMYEGINGFGAMYQAGENPHTITPHFNVDWLMGSDGKAPLSICIMNK